MYIGTCVAVLPIRSTDVSFQHDISVLIAVRNTKDLELYCSVPWQIWLLRNNVVWSSKSETPSNVVNGASSLLFQWQKTQVKQTSLKSRIGREGVLVWQRPTPDWKTCNVDAAVFESKGSSSFGCLLRDENGEFVAGVAASWQEFWIQK